MALTVKYDAILDDVREKDVLSVAGSGVGFLVQTATDTYQTQTITGTTGNIVVTNGDGTGVNPTIINIGSNVAVHSENLSVFAATTSAQLLGVISDETGTGALVFANTPTLVTPVLGVASATTVNRITITTPATGATLTITDGKTLSVTNDATLSGTNTGDQTITLTGNVTGSGTGSFAATIANGAVTLAKMANMATASILGRNTAGTGAPEVLSASTTKTLLSLNNVENTALSTWAGSTNITTLGTITAGTWTGTAVAVANGGTGSTTASGARTALGLAIGTDVQAYDAELAAIAGLTSAADKLPYFTGSGTAALADFSSFGRSLVDDAAASNARTTLGLGTIATQNSNNVTITGGSITGITDLVVADGGTGASTLTGILKGNGTSAFTAVTAPSGAIVGDTDTQTLTNKAVTPRSNTITSSATPTINTDTTDIFTITALAATITSMTTNLSGTIANGQKIIIRFLDNGTARPITWGTSYASRGDTLPTTTVISKYLYVGLIGNTTTSKWDCVAVAQEA